MYAFSPRIICSASMRWRSLFCCARIMSMKVAVALRFMLACGLGGVSVCREEEEEEEGEGRLNW